MKPKGTITKKNEQKLKAFLIKNGNTKPNSTKTSGSSTKP
jgi:hypothetical protein